MEIFKVFSISPGRKTWLCKSCANSIWGFSSVYHKFTSGKRRVCDFKASKQCRKGAREKDKKFTTAYEYKSAKEKSITRFVFRRTY
ncbi:Uncharacterised protein [Streptococcus pneumoniae]|nr:Uncharacterised protein [Streptococcus pneumoniae]